MKELVIESFKIKYSIIKTEEFPHKICDQFFVDLNQLPTYFVGKTELPIAAFYKADIPELNEKDYQLPENFQQIIKKFPHTNTEQVYFDGKTYQLKNIPYFIDVRNYIVATAFPEKYQEFLSIIKAGTALQPFFKEDSAHFRTFRGKELLLDGSFGSRTAIVKNPSPSGKEIQNKLEYVNELYSFAYYSYAAMVQFLPQFEIQTYDAFHEAYGKYIYSVTITRKNTTIPLLWPDYLYHKPENHLEFGVLANTTLKRYTRFNHWQAGEKIIVEILATGFEDVRFETHLKEALSQPPKLSKTEYIVGETISLTIEQKVSEELESGHATFEIITPQREKISNEKLHYELSAALLKLPSDQLNQQGRYQLKILSKKFGQVLLLFTLKKKG